MNICYILPDIREEIATLLPDMLDDFGWSAKEAYTKLVDLYGENVISHSTCKTWFAKFKRGDLFLEDALGSGN